MKRVNSPQDESAAADLRCEWSKIPKVSKNLSKAGWSWGCVSAVDLEGRTIWTADAHRGHGKCYVVQADEKLIAFLELEAAICACGELPRQSG